MAVRLSTLAEIKVLSLATLLYDQAGTASQVNSSNVLESLNNLRDRLGDPATLQSIKNADQVDGLPLFQTVGIARSLRIDEDFGTQNIYAIGAPTRPRIVPNNYSVNVTIERIQLDTRDLNHYLTSPNYWYADLVQRVIGVSDILLYTFLFVKSKEVRVDSMRGDIYAVMPRGAQRAITSGDVMIAHNVSMVGFKYSFEEAVFDVANLIIDSITSRVAQ